jgi:hypothetical protein
MNELELHLGWFLREKPHGLRGLFEFLDVSWSAVIKRPVRSASRKSKRYSESLDTKFEMAKLKFPIPLLELSLAKPLWPPQ